MVAVHLLKWVHFMQDTEGRDLELRYFRDVDGREVNFVIVEDRKPLKLIEVKWSPVSISKGLKYLARRFPGARASQISAVGDKAYLSADNIRVCPALDFLMQLV